MASILVQDPVYITVQEVQDSTNVTGLAGETTDNIKRYIYEAQKIIDAQIVAYGEPYVETQEFIFPIKDEDGNSELPTNIKIATLYTVENIYLAGAPTTSDKGEVLEERVGDHTVKYAEGTKTNGTDLPDKAKVLLSDYLSSFIKNKSY